MTKLGMVIDLSRCVGCHTCANACKMSNNVPMGMLWNRVLTDGEDVLDGAQGTYPDLTRRYVPLACQHCENPACMKVCPTGATHKDEKGRVEIDYDKCIGCRFCMAACPYNARVFNWSEPDHDPDFQTGFKDVPVRPRGVMEKCTLCKEHRRRRARQRADVRRVLPVQRTRLRRSGRPQLRDLQDRPADLWPGNHGHVERHVLGGHARSR